MSPEEASMANQAEHYNAGQAKAVQKGPMHVITFWTNVCRKVAKDALENGDPSVANRLASQLHDFYRSHGQ